MQPKLRRAAAWLLLVFLFAIAGSVALRESVTVDEVAHIGAGLSYLQRLDLRLNAEHPPLGKIIAAVPLALRGTAADYSAPSWKLADTFFPAYMTQWMFGDAVVGRWNPWRPTLFWARLPMLLLTLWLGWLMWDYGRRLGRPTLLERLRDDSGNPGIRPSRADRFARDAVFAYRPVAAWRNLGRSFASTIAAFRAGTGRRAPLEVHRVAAICCDSGAVRPFAILADIRRTARSIRAQAVAAFGRPSYHLVNDSNVSWNGGLPAVEEFVHEQKLARVALDWAALSDPAIVVPEAEAWDCQAPRAADAGQWAVVASVSILENRDCSWLQAYPREALAGGEFYAFQLPKAIPEVGAAGGPPPLSRRRPMWGVPFDIRGFAMDVERHPDKLPGAIQQMMQNFQKQNQQGSTKAVP